MKLPPHFFINIKNKKQLILSAKYYEYPLDKIDDYLIGLEHYEEDFCIRIDNNVMVGYCSRQSYEKGYALSFCIPEVKFKKLYKYILAKELLLSIQEKLKQG